MKEERLKKIEDNLRDFFRTAQEWSVRASAVLYELSAPNSPESTQSLHVEGNEVHTAITAG